MSFGTELKDEFDKLCLALRGSVIINLLRHLVR